MYAVGAVSGGVPALVGKSASLRQRLAWVASQCLPSMQTMASKGRNWSRGIRDYCFSACTSMESFRQLTKRNATLKRIPSNADMLDTRLAYFISGNSSSNVLLAFRCPIRSNEVYVDGAKARSPTSYIRERYTALYASSRLYPECFLSFSQKCQALAQTISAQRQEHTSLAGMQQSKV